MQRRDLLKRLPALPLVIGAAVSQATAFVRSPISMEINSFRYVIERMS